MTKLYNIDIDSVIETMPHQAIVDQINTDPHKAENYSLYFSTIVNEDVVDEGYNFLLPDCYHYIKDPEKVVKFFNDSDDLIISYVKMHMDLSFKLNNFGEYKQIITPNEILLNYKNLYRYIRDRRDIDPRFYELLDDADSDSVFDVIIYLISNGEKFKVEWHRYSSSSNNDEGHSRVIRILQAIKSSCKSQDELEEKGTFFGIDKKWARSFIDDKKHPWFEDYLNYPEIYGKGWLISVMAKHCLHQKVYDLYYFNRLSDSDIQLYLSILPVGCIDNLSIIEQFVYSTKVDMTIGVKKTYINTITTALELSDLDQK